MKTAYIPVRGFPFVVALGIHRQEEEKQHLQISKDHPVHGHHS